MVFLAGPRQVGKTTTSLQVAKKNKDSHYFSWDDPKTRQDLLLGFEGVAEKAGLNEARQSVPLVVFDEIHKYAQWKDYLKGFFDQYQQRCHILVTGSAKLNLFKRAGDSLMGRYFFYRLHPLSVREILGHSVDEEPIASPKRLSKPKFQQLVEFGGFPEPYLKAEKRFSNIWHRLRQEQLIWEDIRDLSQIQELSLIEKLSILLRENVSQQLSYTSLANMLRVSVPSVSRWLETLESFYYTFSIRPWSKNVKRSLRKEPKYYLWDWSPIKNQGAKLENMVASHLLKAVHTWTDAGYGDFDLFYLRDKEKREVDFLVTHDDQPWFLVEVKKGSQKALSSALFHFQKQCLAPHAFQVSFALPYTDVDCFSYNDPVIVPAATFLSQLV